MGTVRALAGWVLFLVMAVIAALFWHQSDVRGQHIVELENRIVEINAQINHLTNEVMAIITRFNQLGPPPPGMQVPTAEQDEGEPAPFPENLPVTVP